MSKHEIEVFNQHKVLMHSDRIKSFFANPDKPCLPLTLSTDLSYICNHRCPWCLSGDVIDGGKEVMSKEIMNKIIRSIDHAQYGFIVYHTKAVCCSGGGDPTTNKDLDYYLSSLQDIGIETSMNTNGQILDKRLHENTLRKMKYIRFSVDAYDEESHQFAHNRESAKAVNFKDVMRNIEWAAKVTKENDKNAIIGIGYLVHENCIPNVKNAGSWDVFYTWLNKLDEMGVDYIQFRPLKDEEQYENRKVIHFISTVLEHDKNKKYKNLSMRITFEKMEDTILGVRYPYCYQAPLIGNIGPTGIVYNCPDLRHNEEGIIGCIEDDDLRYIWGGTKHREWLKKRNFETCPKCKYQYQNNLLHSSLISGDIMHRNFI